MNNNFSNQKKELLSGIIEALSEEKTMFINNHEYGLFDKGGAVLFFSYLYLASHNEEYLHRALLFLDKIITDIEDKVMNFSFSNGVTGILWMIKHLENIGILNHFNTYDLSEIHQYIVKATNKDRANGNYDLFAGLIGKAIYFLEYKKINKDISYQLMEILITIESLSIPSKLGVSWIDEYDEPSVFNLGMAHGIPSVITLLCKLIKLNIYTENTLFLIQESVKWLLFFENKKGIYSFPSKIESPSLETDGLGRMAWCYGDLGIGLAIYKASIVLKDNSLMQKSLKIIQKCLQIGLLDSGILYSPTLSLIDTCFCHGIAGVIHYFSQSYKITGNLVYKNRIDYWLKICVDYKINDKTKSISGFLSPEIIQNQKVWNENYSLLDGITGFGLVLISELYNIKPNWSKIFLADV